MPAAHRQRQLLHQGGRPGTWGNLGLWADGGDAPDLIATTDYAGACRALALSVGDAAGLQPGARVLSLACGAGDELLLWTDHFGASRVLGVEVDPAAARLAQGRQAPIERLAFHQIHRQPVLPGGLADVEHAHDVRMIEAGQHQRFDGFTALRRSCGNDGCRQAGNASGGRGLRT